MQKIIDNLGITISSVCAPLLATACDISNCPYSFIASHEFHEALIYFIHRAFIAFALGCRRHKDIIVAVMGAFGIILFGAALLMHDVFHSAQHSEELTTILITISGSVLLVFSHLRNRKLCMQEDYSCTKIINCL